jgi:LAS superfamily LD-carboxypeptidase LdcB
LSACARKLRRADKLSALQLQLSDLICDRIGGGTIQCVGFICSKQGGGVFTRHKAAIGDQSGDHTPALHDADAFASFDEAQKATKSPNNSCCINAHHGINICIPPAHSISRLQQPIHRREIVGQDFAEMEVAGRIGAERVQAAAKAGHGDAPGLDEPARPRVNGVEIEFLG